MTGEANTIQAVVRHVDGGQATVEVAQGGCGRCHEKGGCGGQHLTQMFCGGPRHYHVDNAIGAEVGERVLVAVSAGSLRRGANLAYGLPILGLIGGALLGGQLFEDTGAMFGGAFGLILAFVLVVRKSRRPAGNSDSHPHIISRLPRKQEECSQ